jgi:outer membrane protein OmpA-like peptidoglycan-associated protein
MLLVVLDLGVAPAALRNAPPSIEALASAPHGTALASLAAVPAPVATPPVAPPPPPSTALPADGTVVAEFESSRAETKDRERIERLAAALATAPAAQVQLEGYADRRGPQDFNMSLSMARALWVREQMIRLGVKAERIDVRAMGSTGAESLNDEVNPRRVLVRIVTVR